MSESASYKAEFPTEINVGQKVPDYSGAMAEAAPGGDKKPSKTKTVFPSLYIDGGPDLAKIPKTGYALIKFKRRSIRVGEGGGPMASTSDDGKKEGASVELEVQEFCLPSGGSGDVKDAFADFAAKQGVDTEGMASGQEEPDGDEGNEEDN